MSTRLAQVQSTVDDLIRGRQYERPQAEKDALLTSILRQLCQHMMEQCQPYSRFLEQLGENPNRWEKIADIPPLPVSMFKMFELSAVPHEKVVRVLTSSSTTGQQPSRIFVDKTTAFRQTRALASILKSHIGGCRRPFLVVDAAETVAKGEHLSARGTAIRGIANFASKTTFGLKRLDSGDLQPDFDRIEQFFAEHSGKPVLLFGFTFMVWTRFVAEAEKRGLRFQAPSVVLLHAGGWKKLQDQSVSRDEFRQRTAAVLGCDERSILDFYGMVEQLGTIFVDCEAGHKHAPSFADVVIRRPYTLLPVDVGEIGIIEVVSTLPSSYPGQALITEDQGRLIGIDDCPCGRKGTYFKFTKRIERADIRGCGDTFAYSRELV